MGGLILRLSAVWASLAALYILCAYGSWPPTLRPKDSGDWAQWVGAIGSIAGAIGSIAIVWVTARLWYMDRIREREREAKAAHEKAASREFLAWQQAVLINPLLLAGAQRADALKASLRIGTPPPGSWEIYEAMQIHALLTDASAFEKETANLILHAIAAGTRANTQLKPLFQSHTLDADQVAKAGSQFGEVHRYFDMALRAVRQLMGDRMMRDRAATEAAK